MHRKTEPFGHSIISAHPGHPADSAGVMRTSTRPTATIFEVSWEACSQTGGIYTVLRTKCAAGMELGNDQYHVIGPYREESARIEFETESPAGAIAEALEELRGKGVRLHYGRWIIRGRPRAILIDLESVAPFIAEMKYFLWKDLAIETHGCDAETDGVVAFGYVVADLLTAVRVRMAEAPLLAQFHEWQAAIAIPLLKFRKVRVPTIFTTHATQIGRSLSAANLDLYQILDQVDPDEVARKHGIIDRFQIERAAARDATVFTTVSEITAQESERFLGRKADFLLPNGLNVDRSAGAPHEFQNLHQQCKEGINEFVQGHFFPSYTFDLSRTLYLFISGRYEYRNKGYDVFIDAVAELNRRLKAERSDLTVVAFLITKAQFRALNVDTLNRQAMVHELRDSCVAIKEQLGARVLRTVMEGRLPTHEDLFDEEAKVKLQRMMHAWRQKRLPTVVTHDLEKEAEDPILKNLRLRGLNNSPEDPVKIVYHPDFVTTTSPILAMEYDQFVRGCNIGVFPSYYEPWGYTPMECIVRGIPAITSDLSGFGRYLAQHFPDHDGNGMLVANRQGIPYERIVYQVAGWLYQLVSLPLRERIQLRNRVESHSEYFDWSSMIKYYHAARIKAIKIHESSPALFAG